MSERGKRIGWGLGLLALLAGGTLPAAPRSPGVTAAVRQVILEQEAAWNRGDLDGFLDHYWRSPALTFYSGGTITTGWPAVRDRYRTRYQAQGQEMGRLRTSDLKITRLGPHRALVRGRWHLQQTTAEFSGLFTLLLRRIQGRWLIVHDHTSVAIIE